MADIENQAQRHAAVSTPLGGEVLLLKSLAGEERIGQPFSYTLDLLSRDHALRAEGLLGQTVSIRLTLPDERRRWFNGVIGGFTHAGSDGNLALYRAELVPWLWLLTRRADCRIFQQLSVPEIVKRVFRELGFTDFEERLSERYRSREYCVQYRETDFNFISRLLEEEGIYYFIRHEENRHMLVLGDAYGSHEPCPGAAELPFLPPDSQRERHFPHVHAWNGEYRVQPGVYVLDDYDFEQPNTELLVKSAQPRAHSFGDFEVFDYPGAYVKAADGEFYVKTRIQELQARHLELRGASNEGGLSTGDLFRLTDHVREDENQEYLLTAVSHRFSNPAFHSGPAAPESLACTFTAVPSQQPFRPAHSTPKPSVQGPQTAVVVGPAGEEIYTDPHGRVKVQFHWDRYGKRDENSSCWIRVSHPWAGQGWGAVAIPRIGQEVIVDFLEGDPDQPIIVGRVYNGQNQPPNGLPAAGMVSGIKSNSTPGGGGYNEMSMDDTKGKEKITIHGQYDMATTVEHDQTTVVHNNRSDTVDVDDAEKVGSNQKISIGANQTLTVGADRTVSVGGQQKISVGSNQTTEIGANRSLTVSSNDNGSIGANQTLTVGANQSENIGAKRSVNVGAADELSVGGNQTISVTGPITITSSAKITLSAAGSTIEIGPAGITITSAAQVTVQGAMIKLN